MQGIAQAFSQPTHLAAMAYAVPNALRIYGVHRLELGDRLDQDAAPGASMLLRVARPLSR